MPLRKDAVIRVPFNSFISKLQIFLIDIPLILKVYHLFLVSIA